MINTLITFITLFMILFSQNLPLKKLVQIFLPNETSITAELAITDEERQLGLMFREKINYDQGMLFVFEEEGIHSFWMKNMKIPLDLLWLDKNKRIIHIEECVPPCKRDPCPSYTPRYSAMYVLELKAGSVNENGLELYDKLDFILETEL